MPLLTRCSTNKREAIWEAKILRSNFSLKKVMSSLVSTAI
jgi:hypothetical protein